jgi:hypothetical protein
VNAIIRDPWTPRRVKRIIFWHRVRCLLALRYPCCVRHWWRGHRPNCCHGSKA